MSVQKKSLKNQIADVQTSVEVLSEATSESIQTVETSLQNEVDRATFAENALQNNVNLINTRLGFCQTMEYDGSLSLNTYPFCMGAGVPSSEKFGFFVNRPFKLTGYSFHVESESSGVNVALKIEGREYDPITKTVQDTVTWDVDASVGNSKFNVDHYVNAVERIESVVSVKVVGSQLGAQSDRYRLTLFFEYF